MATNNASDQNYANNADGFQIAGGTTARKLTVTGADMTLTGSGTNVFTFPSATGTLVSRTSTDALTNKDLTSTTNTFPNAISVQVISSLASAVASGTTILPFDDTIPQSTEGDQYMTITITPHTTTDILVIQANVMLSFSVANAFLTAALFQDSTANALAVAAPLQATATGILMASLTYTMAAGTTSATTFKIRAGGNGAGTTTFNGQSAARVFGTTIKSSLVIWEYKA